MFCKELGDTGVQIPEIGIGTWKYHAGREPLRNGLDAGALFIDTAESYGTEPVVAEAIADSRDCVFLATKVSPNHFRRADLLKAADDSLRRLRCDHIDLYQLHEPNDTIPLEETLGAMEDLVDAGKVRFIGVSNFSLDQLQKAQRTMCKHRIVANQVRYNIIDRTICDDLLPYCQANDVTIIAYTPLARGMHHVKDCDPRSVLETVAGAVGRTQAQVVLNWCLCRENVVVIPKGNSTAHVLENCGASDWRLSAEQILALDEGIAFRRRRRFETVLRRQTPPSVKRILKQLVHFAPRAIRRRIN